MVLVERYFSQDFWALGALPLGVALDLIVGDPQGWPHPVRMIVRLSVVAERGLRVAVARAGGGAKREQLAGVVLTFVVVGLVASLALLTTEILARLGGPATLIGRALMISWALAIRSLGRATLKVSEAPSLFLARRGLANIDGRNTSRLDTSEINRACVATIGEKINPAIIAPLFWLAVLGPAGLWGYKAIDTLARMVGDRNPENRDFGWASARLADLADLVPSRLTWLLIAISAALLNEDGLASLRVGWLAGRRYPGSATTWGLAAMAGALGVQLESSTCDFSRGTPRLFLGDPVDRQTVRRAVRIMIVTALHAVGLSLAASILIFGT